MKSNNKNTSLPEDQKPEFWLQNLVVPIRIVLESGISDRARFIWSIIKILDGPKGCFASNEYIGKLLRIGTHHTSNCIAELIKKGYVKTNGKRGTKRILNVIEINPITEEDYITSDYNTNKGIVTGSDNKIVTGSDNIIYNNIVTDYSLTKVKQTGFSRKPKSFSFDPVPTWNANQAVPKHKENTKLHSKVLTYCDQLLKGTFGQHNQIDPSFLDQFNIPRSYPNKIFTVQKLKKGINNLAKLYINGYGPEDKSWLKKSSLATLIYNPRTRKSQLLKYLEKEPENGCGYSMPKCEDDYWLDYVINNIITDYDELNLERQYKLTNNVNDLIFYHNWLVKEKLRGKAKFSLQSPKDFLGYYSQWIDMVFSNTKIHPEYIGPKARRWNEFIKWLEDTLFTSANYISLWKEKT